MRQEPDVAGTGVQERMSFDIHTTQRPTDGARTRPIVELAERQHWRRAQIAERPSTEARKPNLCDPSSGSHGPAVDQRSTDRKVFVADHSNAKNQSFYRAVFQEIARGFSNTEAINSKDSARSRQMSPIANNTRSRAKKQFIVPQLASTRRSLRQNKHDHTMSGLQYPTDTFTAPYDPDLFAGVFDVADSTAIAHEKLRLIIGGANRILAAVDYDSEEGMDDDGSVSELPDLLEDGELCEGELRTQAGPETSEEGELRAEDGSMVSEEVPEVAAGTPEVVMEGAGTSRSVTPVEGEEEEITELPGPPANSEMVSRRGKAKYLTETYLAAPSRWYGAHVEDKTRASHEQAIQFWVDRAYIDGGCFSGELFCQISEGRYAISRISKGTLGLSVQNGFLEAFRESLCHVRTSETVLITVEYQTVQQKKPVIIQLWYPAVRFGDVRAHRRRYCLRPADGFPVLRPYLIEASYPRP